MITKEFITLPLSKIKPYPNNPRINDEAVKDVVASIEQCNYIDPIEVDENNIILSGHTRYKALKQLNYKECDVIRVSGLSEDDKRKYRLLANKTGEKALWDFEKLEFELDGLDFEGFDFGFEINLDANEPQGVVGDDFNEEVTAKPKSKLGDIYQLGEHRLMCGDSTNSDDVARLMNSEKADMVFTDPPYNMSDNLSGFISQSTKSKLDDIVDFNPYTIKNILLESECNNFFIFTSKDLIPAYFDIFNGYRFNILVWCKENPTPMVNNTFLPDVEYLLYFYKKGRIWNNKLNVEVYKKYYNSNKLIGKQDAGGDLHPTIKPLKIIADKVKVCSNNGGIVLDLFGGSGSTLIACEQTNRKCYMMEIDPKYIDVIITRWEKFTGNKAVKIN